jgi:hypothetical protein
MGVARRACTHAELLPEKHPRCHSVSAERRLSAAEDGDGCPRGAPSRGSKTTWTRRRLVRFTGHDLLLLENEACPPANGRIAIPLAREKRAATASIPRSLSHSLSARRYSHVGSGSAGRNIPYIRGGAAELNRRAVRCTVYGIRPYAD